MTKVSNELLHMMPTERTESGLRVCECLSLPKFSRRLFHTFPSHHTLTHGLLTPLIFPLQLILATPLTTIFQSFSDLCPALLGPNGPAFPHQLGLWSSAAADHRASFLSSSSHPQHQDSCSQARDCLVVPVEEEEGQKKRLQF